EARGLRWIEDPGNAQSTFDRNFLRHEVLPRLSERWPHAAAALARSAALLAEDADLLAAETATRLATFRRLDPHELARDGLRAQPPAWRARLLRAWVASLGLPSPPATVLAAIGHELL